VSAPVLANPKRLFPQALDSQFLLRHSIKLQEKRKTNVETVNKRTVHVWEESRGHLTDYQQHKRLKYEKDCIDVSLCCSDSSYNLLVGNSYQAFACLTH